MEEDKVVLSFQKISHPGMLLVNDVTALGYILNISYHNRPFYSYGRSEAEGDLVLIQTFFALLWKLFLKNTS